jgi:hypothetical protein
MANKRKAMTLAEHHQLLKDTGRYDAMIERRQRQEAALQKQAQEWRQAEGPLVDDLKSAGFNVSSAWDLVNTPGSYPSAIPILLDHLPRAYPPAVREGIARALAVPEAISGWPLLKKMYRDETEKRAKDGLAVAIAAAARDEVVGDIIQLVKDVRHGSSRLLLLRALERSDDPRAHATLRSLATDPDLEKEIPIIMRRLERRTRS